MANKTKREGFNVLKSRLYLKKEVVSVYIPIYKRFPQKNRNSDRILSIRLNTYGIYFICLFFCAKKRTKNTKKKY
jgi:hypothetical protein